MKTTKTTFLASNKLNEVKNKLEDTDVQNQLVSVSEKIQAEGKICKSLLLFPPLQLENNTQNVYFPFVKFVN